jgi:hypothetical protein
MVADVLRLFAAFRGKRFMLLWRGSRDGFDAENFHGRCDGHAPSLTLIQDSGGNIFGGFMPVEWESRTSALYTNADLSLPSFRFRLKNRHNFPARKFGLKTGRTSPTIRCHSSRAVFSSGCDIAVSGNCNATANSCTASFDWR